MTPGWRACWIFAVVCRTSPLLPSAAPPDTALPCCPTAASADGSLSGRPVSPPAGPSGRPHPAQPPDIYRQEGRADKLRHFPVPHFQTNKNQEMKVLFWFCLKTAQPVLQVLLHSFGFIQFALSLLQLFEQRLHLRFHALHLRLCLKCLPACS